MPASRPYEIGLNERLKDPDYAAAYLNAAQKEGVFLLALRDVVEARKFSKVAKEAGVNRETLYRTLSAYGNPTLHNFDNLLSVLGLERATIRKGSVPTSSGRNPIIKAGSYRRKFGARRTIAMAEAYGQLNLFSSVSQMANAQSVGVTYTSITQPMSGHFRLNYAVGHQADTAEVVPTELLIGASSGAVISSHV